MRLAALALLACLCLCVVAQGPSSCLNNMLSSAVVSTSLPWCAAYTARYPGASVYAPAYPLCSNALNSTESSASLNSLARFICALQLFGLPSPCLQAFLKFTCHDKLRPCTLIDPANATFAATQPNNFGLPPPPCFSTCQALRTPLGPGLPTCGQLILSAWTFSGQSAAAFDAVVPSNCSALITNPTCARRNITDPSTNTTVVVGGAPNSQFIPPLGFPPFTGPQRLFPDDGQSTLYLLPRNGTQPVADTHFLPCNVQTSVTVPITCPTTAFPRCFTTEEKAIWLARTMPECTVHLANMTLVKFAWPICSVTQADFILNETEAIASYNTLSSLFRAFFHLAPKDCVDQGLDFVCNNNFRSCGDPGLGSPLRLPLSVCRNVCEKVNSPISQSGRKPQRNCRALLYNEFVGTQGAAFDAAEKAAVKAAKEAGTSAKDAKRAAEDRVNAALAATFESIIPSICNKTEPGCDLTLSCCSPITNSIRGQPQWPDNSTLFNQYWTVSPYLPPVPLRCNPGYVPPRSDIYDFIKCHSPWKSTKGAYLRNFPYCAIPCPIPLWDASVIIAGMVLQSIIGTTSYVIAFVTAVTMFLQPHLRSYPGSVSLWQMVAVHIVCFGFVFQMLGGFTHIWCENEFTECSGAFQCGACVYVGLHFHWSALVATVFWWFVAVNTFVSVFLHKAHFFGIVTQILTHVVAWGFPTLVAIIALAAGKYGYRTLSPFCFINTVAGNGWWSYTLFYIPVGFMLVTAAFCMCCVFWEMRKIKGAGMGKSRWYKNFRISIFLFVYLYIWTFIFMYRFYLEDYTPKIRSSFQDWAACSIGGPGCSRGFQPDAGIYLVLIINTSATGWLNALIFGTTKETMSFWQQRFQNVLQGKSFFAGLTITTSKAGSMVNNESSRVETTNTSGSSE